MIMILLKSLGKRTSIGSYYDEKSLTKCYCLRPFWLFLAKKSRKTPSLLDFFKRILANLYKNMYTKCNSTNLPKRYENRIWRT